MIFCGHFFGKKKSLIAKKEAAELGRKMGVPKRELGNENKKDGAQARCLCHQKRDSSVASLPQNDRILLPQNDKIRNNEGA